MSSEQVDDTGVQRIAAIIARYVAAHPQSKDGLDGIRAWWLGSAGLDVPPAAVQSAIDLLVARRVLRREVLPDGGVVFAACADGARRH